MTAGSPGFTELRETSSGSTTVGMRSRSLRAASSECRSAPTRVEYDEVDDRVSALRDDLGAALDKLPAGQRAALELRVVQDLPYQEVAARLDTSELTARMRVSRALRALSAHMKGAST